uniref:Uncharacterized protein n=1 Tax=Solanum tuberosum TaxID=4113 RepID=M1DT95_SOLTU
MMHSFQRNDLLKACSAWLSYLVHSSTNTILLHILHQVLVVVAKGPFLEVMILAYYSQVQGLYKTSERSNTPVTTRGCSRVVTSVSLGDIVLLRGIIRRNADVSFHRLFDPSPSGLRVLEQREKCVPLANRQVFLAMLRLQLLRSFQPFWSFLRLSVHASTKTSNT